jgi:D-tyrosyl-tRNA(Tyr) deacylase
LAEEWCSASFAADIARGGITILIALLQRVTVAAVTVDGTAVGSIGRGLLAFIGIRPTDDRAAADRLLDRLLRYRVFGDAAGKMNLSLQDVGGGLLLVPQFTLAADTRHGLRPGFSTAAPPSQAASLFDDLVAAARQRHHPVATGVFGADMQVALTNDGPVTFWLES